MKIRSQEKFTSWVVPTRSTENVKMYQTMLPNREHQLFKGIKYKLDEFHFRWLKIKGIHFAFSIGYTDNLGPLDPK